VTGVSNLFTREFLEQANNRLNEKGILVQWYHLYGVDQNSLKSLLKSVSDVFPYYTLWNPRGGGDVLIVSSYQPLELDYQEYVSFFEDPKIRADLSRIDIHSIEELINHILMSSEETRGLLENRQANTDEHPIVEFNAPKHLYTPIVADNSLMLWSMPPWENEVQRLRLSCMQ
jgi:spermidine synthase